ncbi:MAG: hypothetical protein VKP72_07110 [bacterium]|nr:hypothetical protein [bacterium]
MTFTPEAQRRLVLYGVEWVGLILAFWVHHRMRPFKRADFANLAILVVLAALQIYGEMHRRAP